MTENAPKSPVSGKMTKKKRPPKPTLPEARSRTSQEIINILYLVIGSLIGGAVINIFYLPLKLTMGGVSGIASIIYQLTGASMKFGTLVALLNIPLLILGWYDIGLRFVWRSIVGTFVYSWATNATLPFTKDIFATYLNIPLSTGSLPDMLIFCLFGGILYGISMGLILKGGYTTGGTDILAVVIHRHFPNFSIGKALMGLDFVVVLSTLFFYRNTSANTVILAMYSFIAMYLTSYFTDYALEGIDRARAVFIISKHIEDITPFILHEMERSSTIISAKGSYSNDPIPIIYCVLTVREVPKLKQRIKEIDPQAFVVVNDVTEVLGLGFPQTANPF